MISSDKFQPFQTFLTVVTVTVVVVNVGEKEDLAHQDSLCAPSNAFFCFGRFNGQGLGP